MKKIMGERITSVSTEEPYYHDTFPHIRLPLTHKQGNLSEQETIEEIDKRHKILNFSVHKKDAEYAKAQAKYAWELFTTNREEEAKKVLDELMPYYAKIDSADPLYTWMHMAYQKPDGLGIPSDLKSYFRKFLTEECSIGTILEAFAGYNSFIEDTSCNNVIATDYCREALERYPFPKRDRILFDLNTLDGTSEIGNFYSETFDRVVVCCGYKYPTNIEPVFNEFNRILKPAGQLLMVEKPGSGYRHAVKREFEKDNCLRQLKEAKFANAEITPQCFSSKHDGAYFLVRASK